MAEKKGVVVPLVTPFDEDGEIDSESLHSLARHVMAGGADGLFTAGTTGEFEYLALDEKIDIARTVMDAAAGRAAVYAGVTGCSAGETENALSRMGELKPDCFVLAPLVYHGNRNLPGHVERLVEKAVSPVLLYNNDRLIKPPLRRENMRTGIVKRLSGLKGCAGLKDSSGDIRRLKNYLGAAAGREDFAVFQGDETAVLPALEAGAKGAVPGMGNIFPELFTRLYREFFEDALSCARTQEKISGIGDALYGKRRKIAGGIKYALYIKNIIRTPRTRDPEQELSGEEKACVEDLLRREFTA